MFPARSIPSCRPTPVVVPVLLTCALLGASGLAAQEADASPIVPGRVSVALNVPSGGGGELALWKVRSETLNRGLLVRLGVGGTWNSAGPGDQSSQYVALTVGPAFRRYGSFSRSVAPYVQTSVGIGGSYGRRASSTPTGGSDSAHEWSARAAVGLAVGAEWFLHESASLSGHGGLDLGTTYTRGAADATRWSVGLSTVTSAIALAIYF